MNRRDALNDALDEVCRRKCVLIVISLSRISRSLRDSLAILERIEKSGAAVVSLSEKIETTSASGKLVTNMMMLLHNFEVNQLRERVTSSMNFLRNNGKRISRFVPYGYDLSDSENLIENRTEREHINTMKAQRAAGRSYWQISGFLQQSNVPSKRNGRWTAASVRSILLRDAKISA
jgi:site-specific DNA recombinase